MPTGAPVIPDFELLRQIGRGSYGEVWLARSVTGIHRAIKIVYRDRFEEARPFEREFAGIKRFEPISRSQDNLVDILHVGRKDEQGYFYYVMELADASDRDPATAPETGSAAWVQNYRPRTLREVLARRKRLPVEECLPVATGLARAVQHLHEHGLIHRDIKPSNVIFVGGIPKLADIGLISGVEESRSFVGTEGFVPPEGPGKPAADLFSFGKVLYEMSTGRDRLEFPKLPEDLETVPNRAALLEFNEVVLKACHFSVKQRYTSASELLDDLLLLQAGRSVKRLRIAERRLARLVPLVLAFVGLGLVVLVIQHLRTREAQALAQTEARYRRQAEAQELATRQLLYAADMNLAHQAYALGDLGRTRALLAGCSPKAGAPDFRSFEWRYYWARSQGDQLYTFQAHSNAVAELAFAPDHHRFASAGYDRLVKLWDFDNHKLLQTFDSPGGVENVGFSPDGRQILISDDSGLVSVKEISSSQTTFQLRGKFRRVAMSPARPQLALGGGGKQSVGDQDEGPAVVWDYLTHQQLFSFSEAGTYVAFSPDGRRLATGSWNHEIKIRDLDTGKLVLHFGPVENNFGMSFSPDGRKLAVGDQLGLLQLWDLETGRLLRSIRAHPGEIFKTAISPDGKLIATVGADQAIRLWDEETLAERGVLRGHTSEVWAATFTSDGRNLCTCGKDGTIRVWSVAKPARLDVLTRDVNFWSWPVFSDDGSLMAAGEKKAGVTIWRVADGVPVGSIAGAERPVAFGPNAQTVLTLGAHGELEERRLPLTNGPPLKRFQLGNAEVRAHVVLRDRQILITGDTKGVIHLWNIDSGTGWGEWNGHAGPITSLALSPDQTRLVSTSEADDDAKVWDLARHELKTTLHGHKMTVFSAAFSPDGREIATASVDDTCGLWNAQTGQNLAMLGGHKGGTYSVAYSNDGKTLAVGCGEGELKFWNLATRRDLMTLTAQPHAVFFARFSPDGQTLATVSFNHHNDECSLELWRAPDATDIEARGP